MLLKVQYKHQQLRGHKAKLVSQAAGGTVAGKQGQLSHVVMMRFGHSTDAKLQYHFRIATGNQY